MTSRSLDALAGARLYFKCENFQKVGAFKARGAANAVFSLGDDEAARGVVTHSSGNHGAALAYAAARRGIRAYVVMPENAPKIKQENVRGFGATIRFCAPSAAARVAACEEVQRETGAVLVHPYDDARVIAGQGTAAVELLEDVPELDVVIAPVGGGGLLSGTAIAAKGMKPGIRVLGAEPANADDAKRSFASGQVEPVSSAVTIADGLRTPLSPRTLAAIRAHVDGIGLASEAGIVAAMRTHVGEAQDHHRALLLGAARRDRREDARRDGRARGHRAHRRQRRPRPAAVAGGGVSHPARGPVDAKRGGDRRQGESTPAADAPTEIVAYSWPEAA